MMYLNQSLTKKLINRYHEETNWCPRQIYHNDILKDIRSKPTDAMKKGIFGETLCIGSGAGGTKEVSLPHNKKTGKKSIDQVRIEKQAIIFKKMAFKKRLNIIEGINTQVPIAKRLNDDIIVHGTLDIFPTHIMWNNELQPAIVDIKFPKDAEATFGDFCWGTPEYMDHLQPDTYHWLIRDFDLELNKEVNPSFHSAVGYENLFFPAVLNSVKKDKVIFIYWVIGYGSKFDEEVPGSQVKLIERKRKEGENSNIREEEMKQRFIDAYRVLKKAENEGWPVRPEFKMCAKCPVNELNGGYCKDYIKEQQI